MVDNSRLSQKRAAASLIVLFCPLDTSSSGAAFICQSHQQTTLIRDERLSSGHLEAELWLLLSSIRNGCRNVLFFIMRHPKNRCRHDLHSEQCFCFQHAMPQPSFIQRKKCTRFQSTLMLLHYCCVKNALNGCVYLAEA